jgi:hypothetical protein
MHKPDISGNRNWEAEPLLTVMHSKEFRAASLPFFSFFYEYGGGYL